MVIHKCAYCAYHVYHPYCVYHVYCAYYIRMIYTACTCIPATCIFCFFLHNFIYYTDSYNVIIKSYHLPHLQQLRSHTHCAIILFQLHVELCVMCPCLNISWDLQFGHAKSLGSNYKTSFTPSHHQCTYGARVCSNTYWFISVTKVHTVSLFALITSGSLLLLGHIQHPCPAFCCFMLHWPI